MATININVGKEDIININLVGAQNTATNNKGAINALYLKLRNELSKLNGKLEHHWWYETFVDFSEDFYDEIYPIIKDMPYKEQFTYCVGYMTKQDLYYASEDYINDLNAMLKCAFR
jgi:hypothetical protein